MQLVSPCHGDDGAGKIPGVPDFTDSDSRLGGNDQVLIDRILNGYQSPGSPMAMPPKGGNPNLTKEDIVKVIAFMRSKFGN